MSHSRIVHPQLWISLNKDFLQLVSHLWMHLTIKVWHQFRMLFPKFKNLRKIS
uniref:Uncharacterized protein n=1 Tax=Arundo donax TaxID=35708 RepID=A0A0A9EGG3_ARUDO